MEVSTSADHPLRDYVTIRDVAAALDISYYTAYALAAQGRLGTPVLIGRTQLYPRATAERAIQEKRAARGARDNGGMR
jgi:hypothetical protein